EALVPWRARMPCFLWANNLWHRRDIDHHRARGQLVSGQFATLPPAPSGLIADAKVFGRGGQVPAPRNTQHRAFVNYPTMLESGCVSINILNYILYWSHETNTARQPGTHTGAT